MVKNLSLIFFTFLIVSCSTSLDFHSPTQNFITPEVAGRTARLRGQIEYSNSTKFRMAELEQETIFSSQVNVSTEKGTTKDNILNGMLGVGLGNSVEVHFRNYSDSADILGVKVQLLGRDGGTLKEGVKASVFLGAGSSETDDDNLTASNLSGTTRVYRSTLNVSTVEYGAVVGYRFNQKVLTYLSLAKRDSEAEATLTSSEHSNLEINADATITNAQLGLQGNNDDLYFLLEAGYARSKWQGLEARNDYSLGLGIGLFFN